MLTISFEPSGDAARTCEYGPGMISRSLEPSSSAMKTLARWQRRALDVQSSWPSFSVFQRVYTIRAGTRALDGCGEGAKADGSTDVAAGDGTADGTRLPPGWYSSAEAAASLPIP